MFRRKMASANSKDSFADRVQKRIEKHKAIYEKIGKSANLNDRDKRFLARVKADLKKNRKMYEEIGRTGSKKP